MRDRFINFKPQESPIKKISYKHESAAAENELTLLAEEFGAYTGLKYVYPVSSYSAALLTAFYTLNLGSGTAVATSAYNFPEIAGAIELIGAKPIFVDVDNHNYTMNLAHFELMLSNDVKAVIASHIFGAPCAIDSIVEAAKIYKLFVIEDVNTSLGCVYKGYKCGTLGHISVFNFDSASLINAGGGGIVATSNEKVNDKLKIIMNGGRDPITGEIKYPAPDFSMSPDTARVIREHLKFINELLDYKYTIAKYYKRELAHYTDIALPEQSIYSLHTFNYIAGFFKKSEDKLKFQKAMAKSGINFRKSPVFVPGMAYYKNRYDLLADKYKSAACCGNNIGFMPTDYNYSLEKIEEIINNIKSSINV